MIDKGQGIKKENLNRIFDEFYTTKSIEMGSGLGLYIVKQIVEKMNGSIWPESHEGLGTTIFIKLPLV